MALVAGFAGSFVGAMLFSLIAGDGLKLRLSGVLGSITGAVIVTAIWQGMDAEKQKPPAPPTKAGPRSGRPN